MLMFTLLVALRFLTTDAYLVISPLSIYNTSTLIRKVASSLEIRCTVTGDQTRNPSTHLQLQICKKRDCVTTRNITHVSTRSIELRLAELKLTDSGTYICTYQAKNQTEATHLLLKVGTKPEAPKKIRCLSESLSNLNCFWTHTKKQKKSTVPSMWNVTFSWRPKGAKKFYGSNMCPKQDFQRSNITCILPACEQDCNDATIYPMTVYRFKIHGWNQLGDTSHIYDVDPLDYVKFSPVERLSMKSEPGVMNVSWNINEKIHKWHAGFYNLTFEVIYEANGRRLRQTKKFTSKVASNYSVRLKDIRPIMLYRICVKMRLTPKRGYWSDETCKYSTSAETAPTMPPTAPPWAFYINDKESKVNIFLKDLDLQDRTSKKYSYSIAHMVKGKKNSERDFAHSTCIQLPSSWTTYESPNFSVDIRTKNHLGYSTNSTQIKINMKNKRFLPQKVVVKKNTDEHVYIVQNQIDPDVRKNVQKIGYIACRGYREENKCKSDFDWFILPGNSTETTIDTKDTKNGDWIFGVALISSDNSSGGIVFADCYKLNNSSCDVAVAVFNTEATIPVDHIVIIVCTFAVIIIIILFVVIRYIKEWCKKGVEIILPKVDVFKGRQEVYPTQVSKRSWLDSTYKLDVNGAEIAQLLQINNGSNEETCFTSVSSIKTVMQSSLKDTNSNATPDNWSISNGTSDINDREHDASLDSETNNLKCTEISNLTDQSTNQKQTNSKVRKLKNENISDCENGNFLDYIRNELVDISGHEHRYPLNQTGYVCCSLCHLKRNNNTFQTIVKNDSSGKAVPILERNPSIQSYVFSEPASRAHTSQYDNTQGQHCRNTNPNCNYITSQKYLSNDNRKTISNLNSLKLRKPLDNNAFCYVIRHTTETVL